MNIHCSNCIPFPVMSPDSQIVSSFKGVFVSCRCHRVLEMICYFSVKVVKPINIKNQSVYFYILVLIKTWNKCSLFNSVMCHDETCLCFAISGVESSPSPSRLASWHLGVRWTRRGLLPHHQTFPLHRDAELQPCGTTSHQLHVGLPYQTKQRVCLPKHGLEYRS